MTALAKIEAALVELGYRPETLFHDYTFADVLSENGEECRVELAAFTQVPESYRSAAFGVIIEAHDAGAVMRRRALGAPILFSIGETDVGVWRVGAEGKPRLTERVSIDGLADLFARNSERWNPQAVHRAKSLGQAQAGYQLDFVDFGLLPAIEHEVEQKLDRLLEQVIRCLLQGVADNEREEAAFRTTFRLLAAKILVDRKHPDALAWADATVQEVLARIETYYNLDHFPRLAVNALPVASVEAAWSLMRASISFRNISSDSLAFVYENTMVTADTRKRFGTHSTPRQVAEYVVSKLDLNLFDLNGITIFEPFTGAGTFLVAALRHLRDQLPEGMSAENRHAFLVPRIGGAEIDSFSCEVATLSLILADYPNANGWKIKPQDLFEGDGLAASISGKRIILCNPPWEEFDQDARQAYPVMSAKSFSKPMAVLRTVLDARPDAFGFVLPQGILRQQQYADLRQKIAQLYERVELTSLPDCVFQRAGFEAAVVVGTKLRSAEDASMLTELRSTVVEDRDRVAFLSTGKVTAERHRTKAVVNGDLWIGHLDEVWEQLTRYSRLSEFADISRGIQWWSQSDSVSAEPREGFIPGVFKPADSLCQFAVRQPVYLNMNPEAAMFPGPPSQPWSRPKVLTNVARMSRGPWRMAAAYDSTGLVASQAFFGIWSKDVRVPVEAFEAILNSPLTNAFLAERATNQHFTNQLLKQLPVPRPERMPDILEPLRRYREALEAAKAAVLSHPNTDQILNRMLTEVDAAVLKAYDLPPRLERRLLEFFRGHEAERRVDHAFTGWMPEDFTAFMPLHDYLGPLMRENRGAWVLDTFTPAPEIEVDRLRKYVW